MKMDRRSHPMDVLQLGHSDTAGERCGRPNRPRCDRRFDETGAIARPFSVIFPLVISSVIFCSSSFFLVHMTQTGANGINADSEPFVKEDIWNASRDAQYPLALQAEGGAQVSVRKAVCLVSFFQNIIYCDTLIGCGVGMDNDGMGLLGAAERKFTSNQAIYDCTDFLRFVAYDYRTPGMRLAIIGLTIRCPWLTGSSM